MSDDVQLFHWLQETHSGTEEAEAHLSTFHALCSYI
jgi:hypothetical protein